MAGVADVQTLEQLSLICGGWDRPVQTITEQHSPVFSGKSSTTSEAWTTRRERRLPPDQIAQLHRGQALVIVRSSWRILPAIPTNVTPPRPPRHPQRPGKRSMSTTLSPDLPATPRRPRGCHRAATGGEGKGAKRPRQPRGRCHHPPGPGRGTTTRPSSTSSATRAKRASSSERTARPRLPSTASPHPAALHGGPANRRRRRRHPRCPPDVRLRARPARRATNRPHRRPLRPLPIRDAPTLDRAARDDGSTRHAVTG